jgi:hypothetical protein
MVRRRRATITAGGLRSGIDTRRRADSSLAALYSGDPATTGL